MFEDKLLEFSLIVAVGGIAQWLAWKIKTPAILLLLLFGILLGPITNVIFPDDLFGDLLLPIVSLSVGIILYEGGLNLRFIELKEIGFLVSKFIIIGLLLTWGLVTLGAFYILGMEIKLALLFGAILIVTGPTVIIPLVRQLRLKGSTGALLKWEAIVNDPIGAIFAVLTFEAILVGLSPNEAHFWEILLSTVAYGFFFGFAGAILIYGLLRHYLIPEYLQNPLSLAMAIFVFAISNAIRDESGLLATTIMGITLANLPNVRISHIIEFKENIRVLLISFLFIILASRLQFEDLNKIYNIWLLIFLVVLILIIRPIVVYASCLWSKITFREQTFLALMAPRGIVAAAIASVFSLKLMNQGLEGSDTLTSYVFMVIIVTVIFYSLIAFPLVKKLQIAELNRNGVLILGSHIWSVAISKILTHYGVKVLIADSNWTNISLARKSKIQTYYGNILSEYTIDEIKIDNIGMLFAFTSNDEVNSLASIRFAEIFDSANVFQLSPNNRSLLREIKYSEQPLRGRLLFNSQLNFNRISSKYRQGYQFYSMVVSEENNLKQLSQISPNTFIPLMYITKDRKCVPFTTDKRVSVANGEILILFGMIRHENKAAQSLIDNKILIASQLQR